MATYNWSIRPGIPNKYSFNVPASADNVPPLNCYYVALFGNDATGNGSRMRPFKSLDRVRQLYGNDGYNVVLGSGVYRVSASDTYATFNMYADGDVVFEGANLAWFDNSTKTSAQSYSGFAGRAYGIVIRNYFGVNSRYGGTFENCRFENIASTIKGENTGEGTMIRWRNNIFNSCPGNFTYVVENADYPNWNNTFHNVKLYFSCNYPVKNAHTNNIYSNCKIHIHGDFACSYSLFHNCEFSLGNTPNVFVSYATIEELKAAYKAAYPNSVFNFEKCIFADPKFNNVSIGDFSLAMDSPAKNLSYSGTYVGAKSVGYAVTARSAENESSFDADTNDNLTISDDSIILTDPTQDASIETKVIPNLIQRELAEAPLFGFNADRNGQYIDSIADLSSITVSAGTNLKANTPYIVEGASISNNGNVFLPGERFTTGSVVSFTSESSGVCREIIEAPQRHTILARFSNGGANIPLGNNLVSGNWYYVSGTINYSGTDYTNTTIKATVTAAFTGTGTVIEAMTNQQYQHYEPGIKFTSNNLDNERLGEIVRGNGDPDYERGTTKEFPINSKFIQLKYIIRVNNLKP